MATKDEQLKALRLKVKKQHQAANRKVNRLRKNKIVELVGTKFDVRRPVGNINKYNKKQLETYSAVLTQFNSRQTTYAGGLNGAVLDITSAAYFKRLQSRYNTIATNHKASKADVFIPQAGMTIKERHATLDPDKKASQGYAANDPFAINTVELHNIKDQKALKILTQQLEKKLRDDYLTIELKASRGELKQMLDTIGDQDLADGFNKLNAYQFDILWNDTQAAKAISGIYEYYESLTGGAAERWHAKAANTYREDLLELLEWASGLEKPKSAPRKKTTRGKKGKS